MIKPKEIKIIFLLALLFSGNFFFAKNDSLKIKFKQDPWVFKYGINYQQQSNNFFKNGSYSRDYVGYNGSYIHASEQKFLDAAGPYLGFGKVNTHSKHFSIYTGAYYTHTRFDFSYSRTGVTKIDTPYFYRRKTYIAEGYIFRHILGAEINFNIDIANSRIILSPFNPAFVFSSYLVQKKYTTEYEAVITYGSSGTHEFMTSEVKTGNEDFTVGSPGISLRMTSPVQIGFEQRVALKKRVMVIGFKGSILLNSDDGFLYGGRIYSGFEF